ncbi:VacJ family lipoprotein [Oligoflexia bacterium]|nr:VacJ family lipoprotein [Oligoflexia bacterium]
MSNTTYNISKLWLFMALAVLLHVPLYSVRAEEAWDPIEPVNRGIFWFNDKADVYVIEPVARGYDFIIPDVVQDGIGNVFANLSYPSQFLSDVLQLKFDQMLSHTGRFLINSTVGLAGFFDVAQHVGLEEHKEDFASALAYHGIPAGPYIVLPFIGPSNVRDGIGLLVDAFLDPAYWIAYGTASDKDAFLISSGVTVTKFIDTRVGLFEAIETAKEASLDYYLFIQSAYYQHRTGLVNDGVAVEGDEFDDEFDEEPADDLSDLGPVENERRASLRYLDKDVLLEDKVDLSWYLGTL